MDASIICHCSEQLSLMNDSKDTDVTSAISQTNKALAIKKGFHNLHINKVTRFYCEKYY